MVGIFCAITSVSLISSLPDGGSGTTGVRLKASWQERRSSVVAFSPDSRALVASGEDGVRLRDAETGRARAVLADRSWQVGATVFSPDGRFLLANVVSDRYKPVATSDLKIWEVSTGRVHATIPYISESTNVITNHFALSPDGKWLAVLDNSERLPMRVKTETIEQWEEIEHTDRPRKKATLSYNAHPGLAKVKIRDFSQWQETAVVDGGCPMVFSPDGKTLVTGSRQWKVPAAKVWDTASGKLRGELAGKAPWMKPMAFSPDGKLLAIGGRNDETLWELAAWKKWRTPIKHPGYRCPVFSSEGILLFPNGLPSGDPAYNMNQEFPCYDVSTLPPRRVELGEGQLAPVTYDEARLIVSLTGRCYLTFGAIGENRVRTVVLHDLYNRRALGQYVVTGLIEAGFSPNGRILAVWSQREEPDPAGQGNRYPCRLELLDPATGRVLHTIPTPEVAWQQARWRFSPDGECLAVWYTKGPMGPTSDPNAGDRPGTVDLWEVPPR